MAVFSSSILSFLLFVKPGIPCQVFAASYVKTSQQRERKTVFLPNSSFFFERRNKPTALPSFPKFYETVSNIRHIGKTIRN